MYLASLRIEGEPLITLALLPFSRLNLVHTIRHYDLQTLYILIQLVLGWQCIIIYLTCHRWPVWWPVE